MGSSDVIRKLALACLLLAACAPKVNSNPSLGQIETAMAESLGSATMAISESLFTREEETYADRVSHSRTNYLRALDSFLVQRDLLANNTALSQDSQWQADLAAALEDLSAAGVRFSTISPIPDKFLELNPLLSEIGEKTADLIGNYSSFAASGDTENEKLANASLEEIQTLLDTSARLYSQIISDNFLGLATSTPQ